MESTSVSKKSSISMNLYNNIALPSLEQRNNIVKYLYGAISNKYKNNNLSILNVGIGNGWETVRLLENIWNIFGRTKTVILTAIDTDKKALNDFIKGLKQTKIGGGYTKIDDVNKAVENCININIVNANHLDYLYESQFYDIIFSFSFFHHLRYKWREGVDNLLLSLKKDGIIIVSELLGDNSGFQSSFDKVFDTKNISEDRAKYLRFIQKINEIYYKYTNYINYKELSAFNASPILDYLSILGFECEKEINGIFKYEQEINRDVIISALGLKDDNRAFSAYPLVPDKINKDRMHKEIEKAWEILFKEKNTITIKSAYKYYKLMRYNSVNISKVSNKLSISEDLRNYVMDADTVRPTQLKNTHPFCIHDIVAINKIALKNKAFITIMYYWDIISQTWISSVPIICKNLEAIQATIKYYKYSSLAGYRVADYIFRDMPTKIVIQIIFKKFNEEFDYNILLGRDGNIKKIILYINNDNKLIDNISIESIDNKYIDNMFKYKMESGEEYLLLFEDIKKIYDKRIKNKLGNEEFNNISNKWMSESNVINKIEKMYNDIKCITNNKNWLKIERYKTESFAKVLFSVSVLGVETVLYIPSRDGFIDKYKELSTGGLMTLYKNLYDYDEGEDDNLISLVNLRFRSIATHDLKLKTELDLYKKNLKTAVISILIDSYAHNISAHSLSALKWWMDKRSNMLKEYGPLDKGFISGFLTMSEANDEEAKKHYKLLDIDYKDKKFSLHDFLKFGDYKIMELLSCKCQNGKSLRIPAPIDDALLPFFRFLRDKGAFWSGVTRDDAFGGESKTWFEVLYDDFANNPLYLGTIAKSEGISKLNIKLKINGHKSGMLLDFVKINMSIMDLEDPVSEAAEQIEYAPCAFVRLGKDFKAIKEILSTEEYHVFLPGGVIGEHALFTIFENAIRNIKHYTKNKDGYDSLKKNGIDFRIALESCPIGGKGTVKENELFRVTVWLNHENDLIEEDGTLKIEKLTDESRKPILDPETGVPKMGGNSQDKACAAMLFNNKFSAVDQDSEYIINKEFYPWVFYTSSVKDGQPKSRKYNRGYIKKFFYMWKSANYLSVNCKKDLNNENISRFRFVVKPPESQIEEKEIREKGVIRIINDFEESKDLFSLYSKWMVKWTNSNDLNICLKRINSPTIDETNPKLLICFNKNESDLLYKKTILSGRDVEVPLKTLVIKIAHNNPVPEHCYIRSHGKLYSKIFSPYKKIDDLVNNSFDGNAISEYKYLELIEVILTNVIIYDNRISQRFACAKNKSDKTESKKCIKKKKVFEEMLNLYVSDETMNKIEFSKDIKSKIKKMKGQPIVLIMHLTYITTMGYREDEVYRFFQEHLNELFKKDNFIFILTSGRGRSGWKKGLGNYMTQTLFKPIESLLSAVESGISIEDDFDVKYNLIKTIFGS